MKSEQIRKIFHPFTRIPGIRNIFGSIYKRFIYNPVRKREIEIFQKNALVVLTEFDKVLSETNVPYCLFWGSLIGAVREKGFIPHDFDIDVAVWRNDNNEKMRDALVKSGFTHKHRFLIDDGDTGMEDTFEKNGVAIDIFYFYNDSGTNAPYCTSFDYIGDCVTWEECIKKYGNLKIFRFFFDLPHKFEYVPFENIKLPIPGNYDTILRSYYGDNYMMPDPNWRGGEPETNLWIGKKVVYKVFK